jgi:hypothetical protein
MRIPADLADQQRAVLVRVAAFEAEQAQLFARRMRERAELARLWESSTAGTDVIELAGTGRVGQGRATTELHDAVRLVEVFSATLDLLEAGVLYQHTAELLLSLTRHCTEQVQREVERRLLSTIATANSADARRILSSTIPEVEADIDPALTLQRLERARSQRTVWTRQLPDGMCQTGVTLDALRGRRWALDFQLLVRAQRISDERCGVVRTNAQRAADVFASLPGTLLELVRAVQRGDLELLAELAAAAPEVAEEVEALARHQDLVLPDPDVEAVPEAASDPWVPVTDGEADGFDDLSDLIARKNRAPQSSPTPASTSPPDPPPSPPDPSELLIALLGRRVPDPVVMNVHVPMTTLFEFDHRTGRLDGVGPIPAVYTRMLAPVAALRRLYVDAGTGVPLGADEDLVPAFDSEGLTDDEWTERAHLRLRAMLGHAVTRDTAEPGHDPSTRLRAQVELRDQVCGGVGCSQPASRCDLDHELAYPEGQTAEWNLAARSRRCHRAKHSGWEVEREDDGKTRWTSPLGHTYTSPGVWTAPHVLDPSVELPTPRMMRLADDVSWDEPWEVDP